MLTVPCIHVFDVLKKGFEKEPFIYNVQEPQYIAPKLEIVPEESWLEKIVKSKKETRLKIIAQNDIATKEASDRHCKAISDYKAEKESAKQCWEKEQAEKQAAFESEIESEQNAYMTIDVDALKGYLDALMELSDFMQDTVESYEFGYQSATKRLVLEMHMKGRDEIFYAEGYRYMKQRDEFSPIKMKVASANERLRALMIEIAISAIVVVINNDEAGAIDDMVANVYHSDVCCVSSYIEKDTYRKYDLSNRSQKAAFLARQMRISKTLASNVKAFEYIYGEE